MKVKTTWQSKEWMADLAKPLSIAIPIKETTNPNCYYSDPVQFEVIKGNGFIGSVKEGGPVNHQKLIISPHGNGTHTECYGHITTSNAVIGEELKDYHFISQLLSVTPKPIGKDMVIDKAILQEAGLLDEVKVLVIRTLPNSAEKLLKDYSGSNPPYFTKEAMEVIVAHGIEHLVVDLPSVDKEQDEGRLEAHKVFWGTKNHLRQNSTITELAFINDAIKDGIYLMNLQILSIEMDASPSNPVLYSLITI